MVRSRLVLAAIAGLGLSCADAPFESANPNDREFIATMTIVASRDTVSAADPVFVVQVITEPAISGYAPRWEVTSSLITHEGDGVFRVNTPVLDPLAVQITARFAARGASTIVHLVPDPLP